MKKWLRETHGTIFELFRHFLGQFFDSDWITAKDATPAALFGAVAVLMQWMFVFVQPLKIKYEHLSRLAGPGPYRDALRADELWLITLMMCSAGLLTTVKWQSLFPGLRDYRALASLPLRPGQIFIAKLLALLAVSMAALLVLNLFPAVAFPAVSGGRWEFRRAPGGRVLAHVAACILGSYCVIFSMVGLQGVLLNVLPQRIFRRVTGALQGLLAFSFLLALVLSFSIDSRVVQTILRSGSWRWLPPVWFLGLRQTLAGDLDPAMHALAFWARIAVAGSMVLTVVTYSVSYVRHRSLIVEVHAAGAKKRHWTATALEWLARDPRQQAVISFVTQTLAGSSRHRMILLAYAGFGLAVLLSGMTGAARVFSASQLLTARFVSAHVILFVFALTGLRHLFSAPMDLGANWVFRITEGEGRRQWMRAVDRLLLLSFAVIFVVLPLPLESSLLGWRAVAEIALFTLFARLCYEAAFASWDKLPFTCSYLPGKTPAWMLTVKLIGLLIGLPAISAALTISLFDWRAYLAMAAVLAAVGARVHSFRRQSWGEAPLVYEEAPDPDVQVLGLLQ